MLRSRKIRNITLGAILVARVGVAVLLLPHLHAQSGAAQPYVPQWQIGAGVQAQFDVASVKQDAHSISSADGNVDTSGTERFSPTGGLYSVQSDLKMFIVFAYKLHSYGYFSLPKQLPKWGNEVLYDIEARASGNPTKDQYRLMMQALLADRFKLKVHWELRQTPVMAVVLEKPGKLGPQIRPHLDGVPCPSGPQPAGDKATVAGGFPAFCGISFSFSSGRTRFGARNVAISEITDYLMQNPSDRPFIDRTGLNGKYDLVLDWSTAATDAQSPDTDTDANASGPGITAALKNQLGFKLKPETDPIQVLVVDHVEEPNPN